ncbi:hypothetical protein EAG_10380 [Camponotus floridanus]|uniref:Uncharacterized protein n=1 Tax=Camponotus floridanus TaxID=104421 RepID=E2ADP5_CAMFO|nr:uncharacterized protein LOC105251220 [Camponotus floridanus]EFN68407.1 hypothetical protein EAG_10380 [Camponotus floridanus]
MAEIFRNGRVRRSECLISFMIVGSAELCHKISEGLHQNARERRWHISVHQCESIADVVKANIDISVDFIIFASDLKVAHALSEIEANIAIIDEHYIISGATCLVNCNGIRNVMGLIHKSKALCHKYNIRFLSANVFDMQACIYLGSRLLNIMEGIMGLNSGIPIIGTVAQYT